MIQHHAFQNNPTRLETQPQAWNTGIDFSNPASIARYANPYFNNMNNPNAQPGVMPLPSYNPSPYSLNNPFTGYPSWYRNWNPGYGRMMMDDSFMKLTDEERALGRTDRDQPHIIRSNEAAVITSKGKAYTTPHPQVIKMIELPDHTWISVDEYKKQLAQQELENQQILNEPIRRLLRRLDELYQTTTDGETTLSKYREKFINQINTLLEQWLVYDEGRALMIIETLYDTTINQDEFKLYFKACESDLQAIKLAEMTHPDMDYREPYMFRETPPKMYSQDDQYIGPAYKYPKKKFATLSDGKTIQIHDQPRGWKEPTREEWNLFLDRLRAERDRKIKEGYIEETKKILLRDQENAKEYTQWDVWGNMFSSWRSEQRQRQKQHDFYKYALRNVYDDNEFESWWYYGRLVTPQADMNSQQKLAQIDDWRRSKIYERQNMLAAYVQPINWDAVRAMWAYQANMAIDNYVNGAITKDSSLRDVFDNLGYLRVRAMEDRIQQQRRDAFNLFNTIDKRAFHRDLVISDNEAATENPVKADSVHPIYGLPSTFIDYSNIEGYEEKRDTFDRFCHTVTGTVPMKPIFK